MVSIMIFDLFIKNSASHMYIPQGLLGRDQHLFVLRVLRVFALEIRISRSVGIGVHTYILGPFIREKIRRVLHKTRLK